MYKIIIAIVAAYFVTQISKTIISYNETGKWDWAGLIFENGGMPSTHTSVVSALSFGLLFQIGITYETIIAVVFSLIVANDAMKVRRETGEEAKVINTIIDKENILHKHLITRIGHTPMQVLIGAIVGIVCALAVYMI